MSRKTQVAELHGRTVLDLSQQSMEQNLYFALAKVAPAPEDARAMNLLLGALLPVEEPWLDAVDAARESGALPNAYLSARLAALGDGRTLAGARAHARALVDVIREHALEEGTPFAPDVDGDLRERFLSAEAGPAAATTAHLLAEVVGSGRRSVPVQLAQRILALADRERLVVRDLHPFLLATLAVSAFWTPLLEKRMTRQVVEDAVAYVACVAQLVACSALDRAGGALWGELAAGRPALGASFTEHAFRILFGRAADAQELLEFRTVVGLTVTNGPGTLSAKGAKESVSARNDISMSFVGFLSNTGRAHGGNGVEAVEFLLRTFEGVALDDPGREDHGIDLAALANRTAKAYGLERARSRESRDEPLRPIPCVNHPVFRGQDVNVDPREQYVRGLLERSGASNVFLDFYHHLVRELFAEGVTRNVFCVNVDAVIAVITLKLVWKDLREGRLGLRRVQEIGFLLFLFGRALGTAAEIADHRDRGIDMDCRTPEDRLEFVM
jgi:citrate synthase